MPTRPYHFTRILFFLSPLLLLTCTSPVSPEYQFIDGLIYIEGFVGTSEGASYMTVTESDLTISYRNEFIRGANAFFVDASTNEKIPLVEENLKYVPSLNFKGEIGQKWYLEVNLPNGKQYLSEVETINPSVPIKELNVRYDKQLEFIEDYNEYVPGHEVSITFDDPANETNYYYWRFKTYDKVQICKICTEGIFRDNECIYEPIDYYTYLCDSDCWRIDYGNKIQIFSDEFSNGKTISLLPIADIPFSRKTKLLVEIQQFSLTPKAYNYYKTIKDLVNNSGGFNAPLPAALIGNMYNPEDPNEYVLGRFTASSAFTKTIIIDRTIVEDSPIENPISPHPEPYLDYPPYWYGYAPCIEGRYRTSIEPEGWID